MFSAMWTESGRKTGIQYAGFAKGIAPTVANIPACLIGVEVSAGAFYWQRAFEKLGHKVKVISPQLVKPFVRGQYSSRDRQVLMNMTKKADKYLLTLFIHGARAVVRVVENNHDSSMNQWVNQVK